jgi:hypothetical protein
MARLATQLCRLRPTFDFYASPGTHPGNGVFDLLHGCMFGSGAEVTVVHDTPSGMARILRALRDRAAVIMMPDAVRNSASALYVPFFNRALPVQLGAARIARTTGALLVPTLWKNGTTGLAFATAQGTPIPLMHDKGHVDVGREDVLLHDYRVMHELFRHFEDGMRGLVIRWQHARAHFAGPAGFPRIDPTSIEDASRTVFQDPRLKNLQAPALALDP